MLKISRALISVSDKRDVVDFGRELSKLGVEIISTGGTAKALCDAGIPVVKVSEYTGYPEMLDGRVKTLHPKVEAGILAIRDNPSHMAKLKEHNIPLIDLVCVNLYPFKKTVDNPKSSFGEAVENIDVGGPTLVRAAAKNHKDVAVIVNPGDYQKILGELKSNDMTLSDKTLSELAVKAFAHTAEYDAFIHRYFHDKLCPGVYPEKMNIVLSKAYDLRYGENPHQSAAYYFDETDPSDVKSTKVLLGDKKLSFNNLIDVNAALELVKEFDSPAAAIIKHLNPSGVGVAEDIASAYGAAHSADPQSAYGCIVALNREPDVRTAKDIVSTFVEVVVAPRYSREVLDILSTKKKMRVLEVGEITKKIKNMQDYRRVVGGMLVQQADTRDVTEADLKIVSKRKPTKQELEAMLFAWRVCKHTKSNSIIFAKKGHTVGIGAGQMSRVDAVKIASMKSGELAKDSAMASDAFFPFRDGIDEAAKAGITAVIHPGGSIRDEEVIAAADEHNMTMAFTGVRCFLH
ncbi:MAG: bifunctional phosphoribosylaminoimidazolecarboxamide formyltransferase/IMP cyclohydrolase [Candidatus Altiarchaeota archaeon]|nr:bifunctional phosphoribosylaminoimidazolecarboxamide formyltransferase/IMP cyclohydrolase [Candidatus Altiarchaeota archaeon]